MIGSSATRKEGRDKVLGRTEYTGDLRVPGLWLGATVRTTVPRGILRAIHFDPGFDWSDLCIVTAADIPGQNRVASIVPDQPFLVGIGEEVAHPEQPVVLLAHPDRFRLEQARRAVRLEVEPLPAVLDLEASLAGTTIIYGTDNLLKELRITKGDPASIWDKASTVIEGEYRTGAQEQLYLETQAALAEAQVEDGTLRLDVRGSFQCPYYVHGALVGLFGLPRERVRVAAVEMGGAFGGKEDYPSLIAGHAALLAWKSGHPVRIVYDREEDMAATTKRHPSRTRLRTAFDAEGHLLALEADFVLDGGAFATMSPVVLSRGTLHAAGVYRCPHVSIHGRAVATNTPPPGAFRGFGAPQSLFAIERHMDVCARELGLDAVELRRRNVLRTGDTMATGQVIREDLDLPGLMDRTLALIDFEARRTRNDGENAYEPEIRRGVGLSLFMHGCGFTGSGEAKLASVAGLEALADGRVAVLAASTEMGQGKHTVFAQVAAEALGVPMDLVEVAPSDTARVPDSGPTVASRSTMVVGKLIQDAARSFRQGLVQEGLLPAQHTPEQFQEAVRGMQARHGSYRSYAQYHTPPQQVWNDTTYQGDAYPTYSWACYAAEVAVDTTTWEVSVEDFVAVQDVGRVINPILATGQVQGGVAQGIGYALWEEVQMREGRMANATMTNYIIPTAVDLPEIRVAFVETPHPAGPGGAKGLGELPMDGPAPALINAIAHALGPVQLDELPMTPERLLSRIEALEARHD